MTNSAMSEGQCGQQSGEGSLLRWAALGLSVPSVNTLT